MIKAIVTGASYGGMEAIKVLLTELSSAGVSVPVIAVLHIGNNDIHTYLSSLNNKTAFTVKEASEKEIIRPGTVYFAPPNYHLQVENNFTFSLSTDKKVNFSRPAIDVLFETAAWTYKENLLGILLTGSNNDGARGLKTIQDYGGITIVENPETAHAKTMPRSATELFNPDYVLDLSDIAAKIVELCR
jgi:two-component system, chemotaxis family, protein-glutamate methylesterase/glutaminase